MTSTASGQPPWSPWLLRAFLKGIAASCGVLSAGCMIFFIWVLSLSGRNVYLLPLTLLLLPVAILVILVGCPLWSISAACGVTVHKLEGTYARVGEEGVQIRSVHAQPSRLVWAELEEVRKTYYPLCAAYLFKLKQGSEVRVDFVDEELLRRHLEQSGTRFQEVWWHERDA